MKTTLALLALVTIASPLTAAARVVTLSVPGMHCAACPITIKKALNKVAGVGSADVDLARREVTVTFDDATTGVEALTRATRQAGYPSSVVEGSR